MGLANVAARFVFKTLIDLHVHYSYIAHGIRTGRKFQSLWSLWYHRFSGLWESRVVSQPSRNDVISNRRIQSGTIMPLLQLFVEAHCFRTWYIERGQKISRIGCNGANSLTDNYSWLPIHVARMWNSRFCISYLFKVKYRPITLYGQYIMTKSDKRTNSAITSSFDSANPSCVQRLLECTVIWLMKEALRIKMEVWGNIDSKMNLIKRRLKIHYFDSKCVDWLDAKITGAVNRKTNREKALIVILIISRY